MFRIARPLAIVLVALLTACASDPAVKVADNQQESRETKECVKVTGSHLCRKPESGNPNALYSISGEDLRRSGGPITGAQPGAIRDGK